MKKILICMLLCLLPLGQIVASDKDNPILISKKTQNQLLLGFAIPLYTENYYNFDIFQSFLLVTATALIIDRCNLRQVAKYEVGWALAHFKIVFNF